MEMELFTTLLLGTEVVALSQGFFPRCWDVSAWQTVQSAVQTQPYAAGLVLILKLKCFSSFTILLSMSYVIPLQVPSFSVTHLQ